MNRRYKKNYNRKKRYYNKRRNKVTVPRSYVSYNGIKNFKLRLTAEVSTDPSTALIDFHIKPTQLSQFLNISGQSPIPLSEVANLQGLFDVYRVKGVKVQWIPKFDQYSQFVNDVGGSTTANTFGPLPPIGMCYDPDNSGGIPYINMITRDSFTVRSVNKPWSKYFKTKQNVQGSIALQGGWLNFQALAGNDESTISFATDGPITTDETGNPLYAQKPMGTLIATCYLQVKVRQ